MLLWFCNGLRANESPAAGSALLCVFIQCLFAWVHGYSHAYPSVWVFVFRDFLLFWYPVRFCGLLLGLSMSELEELERFSTFAVSLLCALNKKRFLHILKRLTTLSLPSAIKSSRRCFWWSYLLNPLHRNIQVVGECTRGSGLMAQLRTINVCPFLSQTYIWSRGSFVVLNKKPARLFL